MQVASLFTYVTAVREHAPLVHNITNYVVMQVVANALLAIGASPVMAQAEEEVEDVTAASAALSLNIGTLSEPWVHAMMLSIRKANTLFLPIIVDPVGVGISQYRMKTAHALLREADRLIVRGNAAEILALAGKGGEARGVDSLSSSLAACEAAQYLARQYRCIVCVSGSDDIITDGSVIHRVSGGSAMMERVTGMGCTASALMAAFAAVCLQNEKNVAAVTTMAVMSAAGAIAARKASGVGSFTSHFLDALSVLSAEDLENHIEITKL